VVLETAIELRVQTPGSSLIERRAIIEPFTHRAEAMQHIGWNKWNQAYLSGSVRFVVRGLEVCLLRVCCSFPGAECARCATTIRGR
jgi:hypothetical protein